MIIQSIPSACYNQSMMWFFPVVILGILCGVIVNYLSDVLPTMRNFSPPFCHTCNSELGLVNYFIYPRKCQNCGAKRKPRTIVVEIIFALLAVHLWRFPNERLSFWMSLVVWIFFGVVIIIDLEHRLILHPVSIAGCLIGIGFGVWMHGWVSTLLGGILGFTIMFALYYIGILLVKIIKKPSPDEATGKDQLIEEALGFGDVNLSGVVGLLLGWPGIIAGITITILLAGGFSLVYLVFMMLRKKYHAFMAIPYGPFIVLGAALLLFFV